MSVTVQEITRVVTATVITEYSKALLETAEGALAGNDAAKSQLLPLIKSWTETTTQRVGAGLANLSVPIAGVAAPGAASGVAASPFAQAMQQQGFGAPQQQGFGQFPPQQQQVQQPAFGGGGGAVPKDTSPTLQGCGSTRVPLTHSNQGCTCGVEHSVKDYTGKFYCTRPADTQNLKTQTWTCSKHKGRDTLDLQKGGKKKESGGAGSVVSAQQVNGLRQPIGLPPGFGANPGLAGGLANAMAQQPQAPGFPGFNPAGFGSSVAPPPPVGGVAISNPQLSSQLMSNFSQQLNNIPQQQAPLPGGATFNMPAMMQAPPAQGVNVAAGFAFPGLGGSSPFGNPAAPPQQIHPQQTAAPVSGSDDDSAESSEEEQSDPIERAPDSSIAAALANAMSLGGGMPPPAQTTAPVAVAAPSVGGFQLPPNPALNAAIAGAQPAAAPQQSLGGFSFPPPAQTAAPNPMAAFVNQALHSAAQ